MWYLNGHGDYINPFMQVSCDFSQYITFVLFDFACFFLGVAYLKVLAPSLVTVKRFSEAVLRPRPINLPLRRKPARPNRTRTERLGSPRNKSQTMMLHQNLNSPRRFP